MLCITGSQTGAQAFQGVGDYKGSPHYSMTALLPGHGLQFGIITHKGTGIKTFEDLKGRRFTWNMPGYTGGRVTSYWLMKAYGWDPHKDVTSPPAEFPVVIY